jgi:uncharacterized membrane protein YgcG
MHSYISHHKEKIVITVSVICSLFLFAFGTALFPHQVIAQSYSGETILNFHTDISVLSDSTVNIAETIQYDFGTNQKHGIFRDIPVSYRTQTGYYSSITLKNITVTDENGNPYTYSLSSKGSDKEIKIGDANRLITGVHIYRIGYTVERAIGYFDSFDEIYWNATGNEWLVPILSSSATVKLPVPLSANSLRSSCYYGPFGATTQCTPGITSLPDGTVESVTFVSPIGLNSYSGLTVAVGFPKGIVHEPTAFQGFTSFVLDNLILLLPILVFIVMFVLWWIKGRDPRGSGVIVAEYDTPDGLTPLEISGILKTKLGQAPISAEIIYLAVQGYIKITRLETKKFLTTVVDYQIDLIKNYTDGANDFDKRIIEGIFPPLISVAPATKKLSELENVFYKSLPPIKNTVFDSLTTKGYYQKNPQTVIGPYHFAFIAFVSVAYLLSYFKVTTNNSNFSLELVPILVISTLIVIGFGSIMPKKTPYGAQTKDRILGLKEYLQIAEKDRINFHDAPEKNPQLFEKLLPYAMALGVEKDWAKEFEAIYNVQPSWYNDPYHNGAFNAVILTSSLGHFSNAAGGALGTAPGGASGSGGGGFSGGGGGGGGGGSW